MKNRKFLEVASLALSVIILIFGVFVIISSIIAITSPSLDPTGLVSDILQIVLVVSILIFTSIVLFLSFLFFKKAKNYDSEALLLEKEAKEKRKQQKLAKLHSEIDKLEK